MTATSGILVLTLLITELTPVLSAVSTKRQFAAKVTDLGTTPDQVRETLWPDRDITANTDLVRSLSSQVREITQMHHSYPALHYFHSAQRKTAVPPNLATLDEAITLARAGQPEQAVSADLHLLTTGIDGFLAVLAASFIKAADTAPAPPSGSDPVAGTGALSDLLHSRDLQRRRMYGFVLHDASGWAEVIGRVQE